MKNSKKIIAVLIAFMLILSFLGCNNSSTTSNVTDDYGHSITLEKNPTKIVSLSPSNTEILFSLGLGDKIVGVTSYCNYPKETEKIEKIGDYVSVDIERIIALSPEIVFGEYLDEDKVSLLNEAGIIYYGATYSTLDKVYDNILTFAKLTNTTKKGEKIVSSMKEKEENIISKVSNEKGASIFLDLGDFYTITDDTFIGEMLVKLKATNIAGDITETNYPQLSLETILEKNPNVYISFLKDKETLEKITGLNNVDAFKNDQVYVYPLGDETQDIISRPGPRSIEAMEILAKILYPELF